MNGSSSPSEAELQRCPLTRHEEISPGVYLIGIRRTHEFLPGQTVGLAVDLETPPRIYSICSGASEEELTVLFNIKADGFLTPKLATLKPGDPIYVSAPYGSFSCNEHTACWIATGTGIAPFRSMVQSGLAEGKTLIHGVRHLNQFYFEEEMRQALGERYIRCCSGEASDDVFHGRVTAYLEAQEPLAPDTGYYLCGQALMAVETRDLLIARGIPFEQIMTEIYF